MSRNTRVMRSNADGIADLLIFFNPLSCNAATVLK